MTWTVTLSGKAWKQKTKLPEKVRELLFQLAKDIEASGPVRGDWPNYSKLSDNRHHCHLKRTSDIRCGLEGRPGTVTVEIIYAGTHEKAPY